MTHLCAFQLSWCQSGIEPDGEEGSQTVAADRWKRGSFLDVFWPAQMVEVSHWAEVQQVIRTE